MILDTTFIIDLLRNDAGALRMARELERRGAQVGTTAVSVFELWRGFSALDQQKMERACEFLDQLRMHGLDTRAAKTGGHVAHDLDRAGLEIDPEDAMIAGIALEKHEEVLTRNKKHFGRIQKLVVETY